MRILAHRGGPARGSVENTVPAITAALAAGADGVEVDLRLTADGVLAASHDVDLARLAASPAHVVSSRWLHLQRAAAAGGVPLARVEWVLAAVAGRPVVLELKPSPASRARTVEALVERLTTLQDAGLPLDVTVSSFDAALVRAFRDAASARLASRTALLGRPGCLLPAVLQQALAAGHDEVHPHISDLLHAPSAVETARRHRVAVVPWTVNSRADVRRCADLGVTGLITDVPRTARLALEHAPA